MNRKQRGISVVDGTMCYGQYRKEVKVYVCDEVTDHILYGFEEKYKEWCEVDGNTVEDFTGLQDKNEKDIYGGDVLEIANGYFIVVRWNKENGSFTATDIKTGVESSHIYAIDMAEIVGNIYEDTYSYLK